MLRKPILAAAIAATVLTGGVAFAITPKTSPATPAATTPPPQGGPQAGPPRRMMRADANRDGVITKQESIAEATRRFDRMDKNRDGKLEASEMQKGGSRGPRGGGRTRGQGNGAEDDR